jgi:hypothetical protein
VNKTWPWVDAVLDFFFLLPWFSICHVYKKKNLIVLPSGRF